VEECEGEEGCAWGGGLIEAPSAFAFAFAFAFALGLVDGHTALLSITCQYL